MKKASRRLMLFLLFFSIILLSGISIPVHAEEIPESSSFDIDEFLLKPNPYGIDEHLIALPNTTIQTRDDVPYQTWSMTGYMKEARTFVLGKMFRNMVENGNAYLLMNGYVGYKTRSAIVCMEFYDEEGNLIQSDRLETDEIYEKNALSIADYKIPVGTTKFKVWFENRPLNVEDKISVSMMISYGRSLYSVKKGWMKDIPDDTPVMHMNIPGSHDAGTTYIVGVKEALGECQRLNIPGQLDLGLRFFDLRYKLKEGTVEGGKKVRDIFIFHGEDNWFGAQECTCYETDENEVQLRLSKCMKYMNNFLEAHPYDFTICRMNAEGEQSDEQSAQEFYQILKDNHVIQLVDGEPTPEQISKYTYADKDGRVKRMIFNSHTVTLGQLRGHVVNGNYEYVKKVGNEPVDRDHSSGYWYTKVPELIEIFNWARNIDGEDGDPMKESRPRGTYENVEGNLLDSIENRSQRVRTCMGAYPFQFGKAYQLLAFDYATMADVRGYIETNKYLVNKATPFEASYNWAIKNGTLTIQDSPVYDASYFGKIEESTQYRNLNDVPWNVYRSLIQHVVINTSMKPQSTAFWFKDCLGIQDVSIQQFDLSECQTMESMFENCPNLKMDAKATGQMNLQSMENMKSAFKGCKSLEFVDARNWNISNVKNMSHIFDGCEKIETIDARTWNVIKIEDISYAFAQCKSLKSFLTMNDGIIVFYNGSNFAHMFDGCSSIQKIGLGSWRISFAESLEGMFKDCSSLESLDIAQWEFYNVKTAKEMFRGCYALDGIDVSKFTLAGVEDISYMFADCKNLSSIDVSTWNTSQVKDMSGVFENCLSLSELDIAGWKTSNVEKMISMFEGCDSLQELDLVSFTSAKVSEISRMFYGCSHLNTIQATYRWKSGNLLNSKDVFAGCNRLYGGNGTAYHPEHINGDYANIDGYQNKPGYFTVFAEETTYIYWGIDHGQLLLSEKELKEDVKEPRMGRFPASTVFSDTQPAPWYEYRTEIITARSVSVLTPLNVSHWFKNLRELVSVDLYDANLSKVEDFSEMFKNCSSLTNLKTYEWDTQSATSMRSMFDGCSSLDSVDCSDWDVSKVTDFHAMFYGCRFLKHVSVEEWKLDSAEDMSRMFEGCVSLESLDVADWDVSKVKDFSEMFGRCKSMKAIATDSWQTPSATDFSNMFSGCEQVVEFYLTGFEPENVKDFSGMFASCKRLKNIFVKETWILSKDQKDEDMFANCPLLRTRDIVERIVDPEPEPTPTPGPRPVDPYKNTVKYAKVAKPVIKVSKRKMTVTIREVPYASGYQIAYRMVKKGTKFKTITVKGSRKKIITKLKKHKKYYVKVRAYTQLADQIVFSGWTKASKTKAIK